jgi:hypothetical protein
MRYNFTKNNKTLAFILIGIGFLCVVAGFFTDPHRTWASLLLGNFFFMALALAGTFFLSVQYVAEVGWSASLIRVFQSVGTYLPYAGIFMLLIFIFGHHDLYHWTHHHLYEKFLADGKTPNPEYDPILDGKHGYLNIPFFLIRMVLYFAIWIGLTHLLRKESVLEDLDGDIRRHKKIPGIVPDHLFHLCLGFHDVARSALVQHAVRMVYFCQPFRQWTGSYDPHHTLS